MIMKLNVIFDCLLINIEEGQHSIITVTSGRAARDS